MSFRLSERSIKRLDGVHPRLAALVREAAALSPVDFMVTEGVRTPERQAALVRAGASRTHRGGVQGGGGASGDGDHLGWRLDEPEGRSAF